MPLSIDGVNAMSQDFSRGKQKKNNNLAVGVMAVEFVYSLSVRLS